jgi:hypothetical protein
MAFNFFKKKQAKITKRALSKEYIEFLLEEQKTRELKTWYEKLCKFSEFLKIKPPKSIEEKFKLDIVFSALNVTPTGVFSASILVLLISLMLLLPLFALKLDTPVMLFLSFLPFIAFWYIYTYPSFRSHVVRIQAGDEAIKIILYMVIYLKLNPNFEGAVNFAVSHSKGPITEDIKKAMWDLHIGRYKTVEEALSKYTNKWVWWNEEFVRSISLLYSILLEPTEERRDATLRKALDFILTSTHNKMKSYVEDIKSPITLLHMMGLLLPAIGLIMFPMISIFMAQMVSVPQLVVAYIVFLPLANLFMINRILQKRPGAFMVPDISKHPKLPPENYFELKIGKIRIYIPILILSILIGLVIMLYGIFHFVELATNLLYPSNEILVIAEERGITCKIPRECVLLMEAKMNVPNILASFSITAGFAAMVIIYFYLNSFQRIKIRNEIKNIESEFQIGLFSIGNYLSEGYPIEVSMQKSLEEYVKLGMEKRPMYFFFQKLFYNIKTFGMTFKRALFDPKEGVAKYYPSVLIEDIMKILSNASEKSSILLGTISKTIAKYLEDIFTIEARIRDILEETRSSIRLQASFVIPMILGIIGAMGIFILNMLRILAESLSKIQQQFGIVLFKEAGNAFVGFMNYLGIEFTKVVPMTVLQAVVGIYTVEVVTLFTMLLSGIENGFDKVARDWEIARTLAKAILIYGMVNLVALIMFYNVEQTIKVSVG